MESLLSRYPWEEALPSGARSCFDKVLVRKPDASRRRSREVYLLAMGKKVK